MKQLDLGAGGANRIQEGYEGYGVDIVDNTPHWLKELKIADLAIQPIPYPDDTFDLITAYDLLEHIPPVVYLHDWSPEKVYEEGTLHTTRLIFARRNCMIELFNEIYRVLKKGGKFYHQTPGYYPDHNIEAVWTDPTHVYVWTPQSHNAFSGDYFGMHDHYGHKSKFKFDGGYFENGHFHQTFIAIKPMEPPYEAN